MHTSMGINNSSSRYIEGGCNEDTKTKPLYSLMLKAAHDECIVEALAETMAVSIIIQPTGDTITYVRILPHETKLPNFYHST